MNKKESFIIEGLDGKRSLRGKVFVNGAKNSALKAMAASILFDGQVTLENVPNTDDIHTMSEILKDLGAKVEWVTDDGKASGSLKKILKIDSSGINKTEINPALACTMRASIVLTGPMLARFGKVSFPAPGGCVIGARPIDLFIEGYKKMGAAVTLRDNLYHIECTRDLNGAGSNLNGANIVFNRISVGGTETLMMAAVLSKGTMVLENCAMEPEIGNVAEWLNACGADIEGIGTPIITINGIGNVVDGGSAGRKLLSNRKSYTAIPDRIETGSFLILGALCAEELLIEDCRPDHLDTVIAMLRESGVKINILEGKGLNKTIRVSSSADTDLGMGSNAEAGSNLSVARDLGGASNSEVALNPQSAKNSATATNSLKSFNVRTHEYPGFPTDLQAPIVTYLTQTSGESTVVETIFEGRFKYVDDLLKMGADITNMNPMEILIKGPTPLAELPDAQELCAYDIRAGFAIVLAALIGKGTFTVNNVHLIDRGYESLETRLSAIGAKVKRV